MRRIIHRVAHWLGRNHGRYEIRWRNDVRTKGFRCAGCGELSEVRPAPLRITRA